MAGLEHCNLPLHGRLQLLASALSPAAVALWSRSPSVSAWRCILELLAAISVTSLAAAMLTIEPSLPSRQLGRSSSAFRDYYRLYARGYGSCSAQADGIIRSAPA